MDTKTPLHGDYKPLTVSISAKARKTRRGIVSRGRARTRTG
jgi:hypothetical protein